MPVHLRVASVALAAAVVASACSGSDDPSADGDLAVPTSASSVTTAPDISISTVPEGGGATSSDGDASVAETTSTTITEVSLGVMPLTGIEASDEDAIHRPVLAVKIDNVESARPQAGLSEADLVYEELVEGGLTRLLAVFHTNAPEEVGPVRSARSTDVPLLTPMREPLFAWSGANEAFANLIRSVAIRDVGVDAQPDLYVRDPERGAPSDLMTDASALFDLIDDDRDLAPSQYLEHALPGGPTTSGEAVSSITVEFGATTVVHEWDEDTATWPRTQNDTAHVDASGARIAPANVIVQFVEYEDTGFVDAAGASVPEAELDGDGPAWFFVGGQWIEGSWSKANITARAQYLDPAGEPIVFAMGSTWVLLAPAGSATTS